MAEDKKMSWIIKKQTVGVAFNVQNSQLLTLSIPTEEIFQVRGKNRQIYQQSIFVPNNLLRKFERHCL